MPGFIYQVEMKLDAAAATERLRRIESWCGDWQIGFRVIEGAPGSETIRLAFDDPRLARAVVGHFGGVLVDDREIEHAMSGDVADEDTYDRLAREGTGAFYRPTGEPPDNATRSAPVAELGAMPEVFSEKSGQSER